MFYSWSSFDFPCKCIPADPAILNELFNNFTFKMQNKSWLKMCSHTAKNSQFVTDLKTHNLSDLRQFCYKPLISHCVGSIEINKYKLVLYIYVYFWFE